jgi:hypothetical protein
MIRLTFMLMLLPCLALAAPTLKTKTSVLYYPTHVGDTLVYESNTAKGGKATELTEIVDSVEEKDGVFTVQTVRLLNDVKRPATKMQVSDKGISRVASLNKELTTPMIMLKLPAKAGEKWENKSDGAIAKYDLKMIGEEEVKVPAGTYKAIRVETTYDFGGVGGAAPPAALAGGVKITHWFAPGVGLVKMVTSLGGMEREQVLKSFTLGQK